MTFYEKIGHPGVNLFWHPGSRYWILGNGVCDDGKNLKSGAGYLHSDERMNERHARNVKFGPFKISWESVPGDIVGGFTDINLFYGNDLQKEEGGAAEKNGNTDLYRFKNDSVEVFKHLRNNGKGQQEIYLAEDRFFPVWDGFEFHQKNLMCDIHIKGANGTECRETHLPGNNR